MKIYIGADHHGVALKDEIVKYLNRKKIKVEDVGAFGYHKKDDYVDYAKVVGNAVGRSRSRARGILLCGSGLGVCMVANKFKGVRATTVWSTTLAQLSRQDDDSNVLCLPADFVSADQAKKIVKVWLETKFSKAKRHHRRIDKLKKLERELKKK